MSSIAMTGSVRPAGVGAQTAGALRLTRRGRLMVFLTCLVAACAALLVVAGTAIGSGEPVPTQVVTVQPGDTLWGIAAEVAPGEDPRDVILQIRELNTVGVSLQVGDKLDVPVRR